MLRRAFMLSVLAVFMRSAAAAELEHTLLFDSGRDGYPRYRIPSLIVTPSGAVLALCEGRKQGRGLTGDIDLVLRASRDSGSRWSDLQVFADDGANTLGNPCAVMDRDRKTLWVGFTRSLGSDTEEGIVAGTSRESTRVFMTSTSDDGKTWSRPVDITDTAKDKDWTWYGTGPGAGLQLASGRLVIPSYHAQAGTGIYRSHMVYSDDHGRTWKRGDAVGEHASECHVVERADGALVLNARTTEGRERRTTAVSRDGGVTWGAAGLDEALYDPHCEACVIAWPGDAKDGNKARPWLFSHPQGPGRRNLTLRVSHDEGKTWPIVRRLREGDSQYSCLAKLPDGKVGCLYDAWVDGNYRLFFTRLDLPAD